MKSQRNKSNGISLIWLLKLIGLGLFVYLCVTIDLNELYSLLSNAKLDHIILSLVLSIIGLGLFKAMRWYLLLRWIGIPYSALEAYTAHQASVFVGLITPGRLGEMFRSVYLHYDLKLPFSTGIASVGADRMFDLFGLLILAGSAMLFNPNFGDSSAAGWYFLTGAVVAFVLLQIIIRIRTETYEKFRLFKSNFMGRLVADFSSQVRVLNVRRAFLLAVVTAVATTIFAFQCQLLATAVGIDINLWTAGGIVGTANLAILIPVTIYGLGTREFTVISLLGMLGISQTQAFSFSMLVFLNFWIVGALWGLLFWLSKPLNIKQAKEIREKELQELEESAIPGPSEK